MPATEPLSIIALASVYAIMAIIVMSRLKLAALSDGWSMSRELLILAGIAWPITTFAFLFLYFTKHDGLATTDPEDAMVELERSLPSWIANEPDDQSCGDLVDMFDACRAYLLHKHERLMEENRRNDA